MNARGCRLWMVMLIVMSVLAKTALAQDDIHTVVYDNIDLSFPSSHATGIQIEAIEAIPFSENMLHAETHPPYVRFSFLNYLGGSRFQLPYPIAAPQILVYLAESIREFGYEYSEQYDALYTLLRERSDLSAYIGASVRLPEVRLPFLPWVNSAQVLRSHPRYVEIAGVGSGVRYVTYYSQEAAHITDWLIFYTFQGIMAEGQHYISAILPVKTGVLPEEVDTSDIDWDEFASNYDTYLNETFQKIDSLPDDAFRPSLSALDALIQSMAFERETDGWQTYTDVPGGYSFQYPPGRQICAFENSIELIDSQRYFDDPDADQCASVHQVNPISIISSMDDDAFQAFRAENYPNSFVDYQADEFSAGGRAATRISGREVETDLRFELVRVEYNGSYLTFRAMGEENTSVLKEIISTLRFLSSDGS